MKRILALVLLATSTGVLAQTAEPAAAATTTPVAPASSVEPLACTKPTLPSPKKQLKEKEIKQISTDGKTYMDCLRGYIKARNDANASYVGLANANAEAANGANAAGNAFVAEMNAFNAERQRLNEGN